MYIDSNVLLYVCYNVCIIMFVLFIFLVASLYYIHTLDTTNEKHTVVCENGVLYRGIKENFKPVYNDNKLVTCRNAKIIE